MRSFFTIAIFFASLQIYASKKPEIIVVAINGGYPSSLAASPDIHPNILAEYVDFPYPGRSLQDHNAEVSKLLPTLYPKIFFYLRYVLPSFKQAYGALGKGEVVDIAKEKNAINLAINTYYRERNEANLTKLKMLYYDFVSAWQTTSMHLALNYVDTINKNKAKNAPPIKVLPIAWPPQLLGYSPEKLSRSTLEEMLRTTTMAGFEPNELEQAFCDQIVSAIKNVNARIVDFNVTISTELILSRLYRNKYMFQNMNDADYHKLAEGIRLKNMRMFETITQALPNTLFLVNVGKSFPGGENYANGTNAWVRDAKNVWPVADLQESHPTISYGFSFLGSTNKGAQLAAPNAMMLVDGGKKVYVRYPGVAQLYVFMKALSLLQEKPSQPMDRLKESLALECKEVPRLANVIEQGRVLKVEKLMLVPSLR